MSEQISLNDNFKNSLIANSNSTIKYYTEYENLHPFPLNMDYIDFIKKTMNIFKKPIPLEIINQDKQIQLDILIAIENLRTARKHQHKIFENIMNCIYSNFSERIYNTENKKIVLNALVLISEIFSEYEFKSQRRWIGDLLNLTLKNKFDYSCSEIQEMSNFILKKITKVAVYSETFEALVEVIIYLSDDVGEVCENIFIEIVQNMPSPNLTLMNFNNVISIINNYQSPIDMENTCIVRICYCFTAIKNKLDNNQFLSFLNILKDKNRILFLEILNLKGNIFTM